jgi:predicted aldo/keto reductase-like oxidoreductase
LCVLYPKMHFRTPGKTRIRLSVVGFGTAQLRMVPEQQAIAALCKAFELGINWVHTAPDYGGAEVLVARAIAESRRRDIMVLSSAAGSVEHFGWTFENTCRLLGKHRLEMFGISGIDYCDDIGLNIWGSGGLLEFLQEMKKAGRLGGIFCSTHGAPEYVARLITSGCFDAVMLSFNPLGFHVLSYHGAAEGKAYEDLKRNRDEIFPLARKHRVGLLVIKPLAGGLMCRSQAFPPRERFSRETVLLKAPDILKAILQYPEVTAVVPGTASVEEAEENARAGHDAIRLSGKSMESLDRGISELQHSLCSRCGACEPTCSRLLPISWLFREGYIWNYPSDTFESLGRLHYFKLHPDAELACVHCLKRTCKCPTGLDIPSSLARVHERMHSLREQGLIHLTPEELGSSTIYGHVTAQVVCCEISRPLRGGGQNLCRLWIENAGQDNWLSFSTQPQIRQSQALAVSLDGRQSLLLPILHDVGPGQRTHFSFFLHAPDQAAQCRVGFSMTEYFLEGKTGQTTLLFDEVIDIGSGMQ